MPPKDPSFERTLGVRVARRHKDGVTCTLALRPEFFNSTGILHGGVIASVADEAAWCAIVHALGGDEERPMTTTELKVNYLRPVTGAAMRARAVVLKLGRLLCVTRVDLFDARGKLSAHATVTYALLGGK